MTAAPQPGPDDERGPVDFLAIEFPGGAASSAAGFEGLLSLADQGVVDILDMEFITKDADCRSKKIDVWNSAVSVGVRPQRLGGGVVKVRRRYSDVTETAATQPGSVAVVVIYENRGLAGRRLAARRRAADRQRAFAHEIIAALDAAESS